MPPERASVSESFLYNGLRGDAQCAQVLFNGFHHGRRATEVEVFFISLQMFPEKGLGNISVCIRKCLFFRQYRNEAVVQQLRQFLFLNNIGLCLIGENEQIAGKLACGMQLAQYTEKWRDAGASGNKSALSSVENSAEYTVYKQFISRLQLRQLLGYALLFRINLNRELEKRVMGKRRKSKGTQRFLPFGQVNRNVRGLSGIKGEPGRFCRDYPEYIVRNVFQGGDGKKMFHWVEE